jgi:hypothetical protein
MDLVYGRNLDSEHSKILHAYLSIIIHSNIIYTFKVSYIIISYHTISLNYFSNIFILNVNECR